jgi:DNA-binding HxlR family transcriptional regulator
LIATNEGAVAICGFGCVRMKSKAPRLDCESSDLVYAISAIGGKWKVRIICLLFDGTKRFGELRRMLPGIHRGTLTYELRRLEADRIVQRTQYPTIPPTVEYTLTIRGAALEPVLAALSRWSKGAR